jgi:hypothetical protein
MFSSVKFHKPHCTPIATRLQPTFSTRQTAMSDTTPPPHRQEDIERAVRELHDRQAREETASSGTPV